MRKWNTMKRVHNIVGLVFGLQLLFWVVSGLFFTLFPIETIRGNHLRAEINHGALDLTGDYISLAEAANSAGEEPQSGTLKMFLGEPVWELATRDGVVLVDARTAERLSPINAGTAMKTANQGLVPEIGEAQGEPVLLQSDAPREYAGALPVWVITYQPGRTKVYIPADSGRLQTIRTTNWRIFDVFWRFHIMDITGEDRIDTWWMKLASFLGLTMVLSGLVLVAVRLRHGTIFR